MTTAMKWRTSDLYNTPPPYSKEQKQESFETEEL